MLENATPAPNSSQENPSLLIAIDYDDTWTSDPEMWREIARLMESRGHTVMIATGRKGWSDDMERGKVLGGIEIIYCGNDLKERAVRAQTGRTVDIWIDDMPGMIQNCQILSGDL